MSDIFIIPADPVDPVTFVDTDIADFDGRVFRVTRANRSEPDGIGGWLFDLHGEEYVSGRYTLLPSISVETIEAMQTRAVEIAPEPTPRDHAAFAANRLIQFGPDGFWTTYRQFAFQLIEQLR